MYDREQIKNLCGTEPLDYLSKKNLGGTSNQKGNDYENNFAVCKLALLSKSALEGNEIIRFYSQILAFIDDLVIEFAGRNVFEHY